MTVAPVLVDAKDVLETLSLPLHELPWAKRTVLINAVVLEHSWSCLFV